MGSVQVGDLQTMLDHSVEVLIKYTPIELKKKHLPAI